MVSSLPTVTTSEVLRESSEALKESLAAANHLSQVLENTPTPPPSLSNSDETPNSTTTTTPASAPEITPEMPEFGESIASQDLKEKAESETFIKNFAAKQQGEKLLSVTDPWFVNLLAEFRAQQAVKTAAEKEAPAREIKEMLAAGGKGKKLKVKKGKGIKGWLVSIF